MKKGRGELFCGKKGTRPSFFLSRLSLPSRCSTPGVVSLERQRRWTLTVVLQGKVCQEGAAERWKGRWRVGGGGGLEVEFPPPPLFFSFPSPVQAGHYPFSLDARVFRRVLPSERQASQASLFSMAQQGILSQQAHIGRGRA